jgi:hypothetical protein
VLSSELDISLVGPSDDGNLQAEPSFLKQETGGSAALLPQETALPARTSRERDDNKRRVDFIMTREMEGNWLN